MDLWCCRYARQMVEPASGSDAAGRFLPHRSPRRHRRVGSAVPYKPRGSIPGSGHPRAAQPVRMIRSARLSFSNFRNKISLGLSKRAGIMRWLIPSRPRDWVMVTGYADRDIQRHLYRPYNVPRGPSVDRRKNCSGNRWLVPSDMQAVVPLTHNRWYASLFYDGPAGSPLAGLDTGFTVHYIGQYWDDPVFHGHSR